MSSTEQRVGPNKEDLAKEELAKVKIETPKEKKVVILLSGGIDSSTVLYKYADMGWETYPLFISYGQNTQEADMLAARTVNTKMAKIGKKIKEVKLVKIYDLANIISSTLLGSRKIILGDESETVVPGRNMFLLGIAAGYAASIKVPYVAYGAHALDVSYGDCKPEFVEYAGKAMKAAYGVELLVPFLNSTKAAIIKEAKELRLSIMDTTSCYYSSPACGKCPSCIKRAKYLAEAME